MVLWFSFVGCDYFSIDGEHMKLEELSYADTCKIIQKVGAVYSSGFNPWVPFVRSDKCKFIRAEDRGRGWGPAIDARSISTYQDCVDVQLSDSAEELGESGRIILELMEYPGDLCYGKRDGPMRALYVFEVLELGDALRDEVARAFGSFVREAAYEEERKRKLRIQERIAKRTLKELGIC